MFWLKKIKSVRQEIVITGKITFSFNYLPTLIEIGVSEESEGRKKPKSLVRKNFSVQPVQGAVKTTTKKT